MKDQIKQSTSHHAPVYGLGMIGALIYFISHASGFLDGLIGVFKAFVWPAVLVYEALAQLGG
jgi:hypothetical protein